MSGELSICSSSSALISPSPPPRPHETLGLLFRRNGKRVGRFFQLTGKLSLCFVWNVPHHTRVGVSIPPSAPPLAVSAERQPQEFHPH